MTLPLEARWHVFVDRGRAAIADGAVGELDAVRAVARAKRNRVFDCPLGETLAQLVVWASLLLRLRARRVGP